jgi:hypothetical protein
MEDVCAYHDMLYEMSVEVYSANKEAREHKKKSIQLQPQDCPAGCHKTPSAYQVALVDNIDQGNTDIENFICGFLTDNGYKCVTLSNCIIPETEELCFAI